MRNVPGLGQRVLDVITRDRRFRRAWVTVPVAAGRILRGWSGLRGAVAAARPAVVPPGWQVTLRRIRSRAPGILLAMGGAALFFALVSTELRTSAIQSRVLAMLATQFTWSVQPGESPQIQFPRPGPADIARGYSHIPLFRKSLETRGFRLVKQARFSPALSFAASRFGLTPPADERPVAGLVIRDMNGDPIYDATARVHRFERYEDVPPVVIDALLEMEDQHLLRAGRWSNPAVDWGRLARAALFSVASKVGMPVAFQGGSTLAVQMEKYRHSINGRTVSITDKLSQIAAASLRVYRAGPDVRNERRQIVLDYLNSVPLGGAPGYGEVHGLGEGLRAWFGLDPDSTFALLRGGSGPPLLQARALKPVLALLCAVRAPTRLLGRDHPELEKRLAFYQRRLAADGVIDPWLLGRLERAPLRFAGDQPTPAIAFDRRRAADMARRELLKILPVKSLQELDKLDLDVTTSIDGGLQADAQHLFQHLRDQAYVDTTGLRGEHLLPDADPAQVVYTLLLFERRPDQDVVRVRADNLDRPFDLNSGMRMELGSTAKLRTLAHYFEIVEQLHHDLRGGTAHVDAADPLTAWAAGELERDPDLPVDSLLARSLERSYSASPDEAFFTGGGMHVFHNFDPDDDSRRLTVRQALEHSTNLVFVRLMRDIVRYHEAHLPYDVQAVMTDPADSTRHRLLVEAADDEALSYLRRAWRDLRGVPAAEMITRLLGANPSPRQLAILYSAWHPKASADSLATWLAQRAPEATPEHIAALAEAYGDTVYTWRDYAYLLNCHPLEVWCGAELAHDPTAKWSDLVQRSADARIECQQWLLEPGHGQAQNVRLRTRIEEDAFADMTRDWRRLGFPFDRMVPSFASAIGSSADRPAALAELLAIIVNGGVRRPSQFIEHMAFGPGTPYETSFQLEAPAETRVMSTEVACALHAALAGVVERGTARRVLGAFHDAGGDTIQVGGKTGSGDNRVTAVGPGGARTASRAINRTAAFVFYIGDRYYGVVTASVPGSQSAGYQFTSALPLEVLKRLAPAISARLGAPPGEKRPEL